MKLQFCLLLCLIPLMNSAFGACGPRDEFECLEPEFQRMLNACNSPGSSYTPQQLQEMRSLAINRGNQFCSTPGSAHRGAKARTCGLFNDVTKCFDRRFALLTPAVGVQPNELARLVSINNTCAASRDRTFLINSRVFLVRFLNTNCQSPSMRPELERICRSARDASACILGSIDRLGEVNADDRSLGKEVPAGGTTTTSEPRGSTPQ